ARPHAGHLRRGPGPAEGQDHPPLAPRVRGSLRRARRACGARAGAPPLWRARRARARRRRGRGGARRGPAAAMSATGQRVLLADPISFSDPSFEPLLRTYPEVRFEDAKGLTPEALRQALGDGVDGLIVRSRTKVTRELLERAGPRLRVIGRAGI